jgi:hypothetical protein
MQDHELYRRILGIESPWQVERVELKLESGEVHVHLSHEDVAAEAWRRDGSHRVGVSSADNPDVVVSETAVELWIFDLRHVAGDAVF